LRYEFNVPYPPAPAPVAVAAPAPAPARTYLVFFDWDRYDLTPRAKEVVAEAAANSTHVQYTQIEVNGYTDTSGTPRYNQGLSIRRAKTVQAQLIADGVPANVISIMGYGETHLLVATGPGVREPQNRRVEIIIK
jgi:OmpA-OmpF porin, OOP family